MAEKPLSQQIEGKYEILRKIGEGGMGSIYLVRHRLLLEQRVIKVIQPKQADDEQLRRRFHEEAKTAIRLRHPHIAQLYDYSVDPEGTAYIVMEYIDGLTLEAVLGRHGPPSPPLCLEIARQALLALGYLHERNYVHRDIAPDNLMLSRDFDGEPVVKLIDLGIAKRLGGQANLTTTGMFLGKVRYSAPEQFSGGSSTVGPPSDVYSFGMLLYELLTGHCPMPGESIFELISGHLFREPLAFEVSDPDGRVDTALRELLLETLDKDQTNRAANAGALAAKLAPFFSAGADFREELEAILRDPAEEEEADEGEADDSKAPGSTQSHLDRQFTLSSTPVPGRSGTFPGIRLPPVPPPPPAAEETPEPESAPEPAAVPEAKVAPEPSSAHPMSLPSALEEPAVTPPEPQLPPPRKRAPAARPRLDPRLAEIEKLARSTVSARPTSTTPDESLDETVDKLLRGVLSAVEEKKAEKKKAEKKPERTPEREPAKQTTLPSEAVRDVESLLGSHQLDLAAQHLERARALYGDHPEMLRLEGALSEARAEARRHLIVEAARSVAASLERGEAELAARQLTFAVDHYGEAEELVSLRERVEAARGEADETLFRALRGVESALDAAELPLAAERLEQAERLFGHRPEVDRLRERLEKEQGEERRQRIAEAVRAVTASLEAGHLETARRQLDFAAARHGDSPELQALRERLAQAQET